MKRGFESVIKSADVDKLRAEFDRRRAAASQALDFKAKEWEAQNALLQKLSEFVTDVGYSRVSVPPDQPGYKNMTYAEKSIERYEYDGLTPAFVELCGSFKIEGEARDALAKRYTEAMRPPSPPAQTAQESAALASQREQRAEQSKKLSSAGAAMTKAASGDVGTAKQKLDRAYSEGAGRGDVKGPGGELKLSDRALGLGHAGPNPGAEDYGAVNSLHTQAVPGLGKAALKPELYQEDPRYSLDRQLKTAFSQRMKDNPITKTLVLPTLERGGNNLRFDIRTIHDDSGLKTAWAVHRDAAPGRPQEVVFNMDFINQDIAQRNALHKGQSGWPVAPIEPGKPLSEAQSKLVVDDFMPVAAHELTHARNYSDLHARGIQQPPYVLDTEVEAFRVEAMTIEAERRKNPAYLKEPTALDKDLSNIAAADASARRRGDPRSFADFVRSYGYPELNTAGKDPDELRTIGSLSARIKADCALNLASPRCEEGLGIVQNVLNSADDRLRLQKSRRELVRGPNRVDDANTIRYYLNRSSEELGADPQTILATADYYRKNNEHLLQVGSRILAEPSPTQAPAAAPTAGKGQSGVDDLGLDASAPAAGSGS